MEQFAQVAVQRPIFKTFQYLIPHRLSSWTVPGARCVVPFGRSRVNGIVTVVDRTAQVGRLKEIFEILDREPSLPSTLLSLGFWLSSYYRHPLGETLFAMLPPELQVGEKPIYRIVGEPRTSPCGADPCDVLMLKIKAAGEFDALALKSGEFPILQELFRRGLVDRSWKELDVVRPNSERWFSLTASAPAPLEIAGRAPRQAGALEALKSGPLPAEILRARGVAMESMKRLEEKGWVAVRLDASKRDPLRRADGEADDETLHLTRPQAEAVEAVVHGLESRSFHTILLHGITGSGKTEVYIRAAAEARARGLGALILVPEISLTPQMLGRFLSAFGEDVAILHSGLNKRERGRQWSRVRAKEALVVLGTRSAVFAPIEKLGLVVVDEEHESSYKQEEGLRYNAKHAALMLAREAGAVVVLGSATPDVETYWAARVGRYNKIVLPDRVRSAAPPQINIIDIRQEEKRKRSQVLLSSPLKQAVDSALARSEQVLLFLNRRGFSPALVCRPCGEVPTCPRCSISLTYHKTGWVGLLCHYCGARSRAPANCPKCGAEGMSPSGIGTQRVMDAAAEAWPAARISRLDRDVARKVGGLEVLGAFRRGEADILIGTQMVAKGHHFPRLTVVGVIDSDTCFSIPDFRAGERGFQMLAQVAGRAGREALPGRVFLQTRNPNHPVMTAVAANDYESFVEQEIEARRDAGFPPFRRIAVFRISSASKELSLEAGSVAAKTARQYAAPMKVEILGPTPAPIERLRGRWRCQVFLRAPGPSPGPLQAVLDKMFQSKAFSFGGDVRLAVDIDPASLL